MPFRLNEKHAAKKSLLEQIHTLYLFREKYQKLNYSEFRDTVQIRFLLLHIQGRKE
jgi:hypothetical protein